MLHATKTRAARLVAPSLAALFAAAALGRCWAEITPTVVDAAIDANTARMNDIVTRSQEIIAIAAAAKRPLSKEEGDELDNLDDEFNTLQTDNERREAVINRSRTLDAPRPRRTTPTAGREPAVEDDETGGRPQVRVLGQAARRSPTFGFNFAGEYFKAVQVAAASRNTQVDERLLAAAAGTLSSEGVGADGGFAVPPDYRNTILERVFAEDSLVARCDIQQSSSNTMTMPSDMTAPWDTTGGIQAYWESEAAAIAQSKVALQEVTLKLHKLAALVPVTEELLDDAPALGSYVNRKAPEKMDFKLSYALAWGTGVGMPLGWMNSPALVTVAAESAQTADTINATNIAKVWGRMPVQSRPTSVWLFHPDAEPQLDGMTVGQYPVYLPPGGFSDSPFGRLRGRPVIPHQICATLGDLGDLMLVDLQQYLAIQKTQGIKAQTSIHLWFDQDLTAFKFTLRVAGQPWWSAPLSMRAGSNTMSPFICLGAR